MPYLQALNSFIIYGAANRCELFFCYTLISNSANAEHRWESTTLTVGYDTSMEAIENLKIKINTYVNTNSREWSGFTLNIDKMEYQNAISLVVSIERASLRIGSFLLNLIFLISTPFRPTKLARLGRKMDASHCVHETSQNCSRRA